MTAQLVLTPRGCQGVKGGSSPALSLDTIVTHLVKVSRSTGSMMGAYGFEG